MQVQVGRGNYMAHYNFDLTKKSHRPKSFSKLELSDEEGNTAGLGLTGFGFFIRDKEVEDGDRYGFGERDEKNLGICPFSRHYDTRFIALFVGHFQERNESLV